MPQGFEIIEEGEDVILKVDYDKEITIPSLEDSESCMARTMEILTQVGEISKIIFYQKRDYEYNQAQTSLLKEMAHLYKRLYQKKDIMSYKLLLTNPSYKLCLDTSPTEVQRLVTRVMKGDPIAAYVELKRIERIERIRANDMADPNCQYFFKQYLGALDYILSEFERARLIILAKPYLPGFKPGDRSIYRRLLFPDIKPDFMFTKLMSTYPVNAEELDNYTIADDTEVTIFQIPDSVQYLYHIMPPEFKLDEEQYEVLDMARKVMAEHKPERSEFVDPERMRVVFFNVGRDLIEELVDMKKYDFRAKEMDMLARILVRYTVGFGLIEVLLQDDKIQDISVNSPMGQVPMYIVHGEFDDCVTNIYPTKSESESWASKLRMISGRPLDEANPILDTELELPGVSTRVSTITRPLDPTGLAFSFRRHRDKPWTLPLFMKTGMITPLAAGLISFLVDGTRTMLIAGTRSSGKSSLLSAILIEIMRRYRIITVEDSVTGDTQIIIKRNGQIEKTTVGKLIDNSIDKYGRWYNLLDRDILGSNPENVEVFSLDKNGKIIMKPVSRFIRHKVTKPIYEIITRTGRTIKVTGDHSLFSIGNDAKICEAKVNELKAGDYILTPRILPILNNFKEKINLIENLDKLSKGYFLGAPIKEFLTIHKNEVKRIALELEYSKSTHQNWHRKGIIPLDVLKELLNSGHKITNKDEVLYKAKGNSEPLSSEIILDENLLTFFGLWIADGCYDKKSVIISVGQPEEQEIVKNIAIKFKLHTKVHSDEFSLMLNSITLKTVMREIFELKGDAYTKKIPSWVYNINSMQISWLLKGVFSGDGCAADKEIVIALASKELLKDIQTLLLNFGIILRIGSQRKDLTYGASISNIKSWQTYKKHIGFLQGYKNLRLDSLCSKKSTHDTSDVIPLHLETKKKLKKEYSDFNYRDYILRDNNIGREKCQVMLQQIQLKSELTENINLLATSDIYFDQIKEIKLCSTIETYVYDFSVPETENFICENIIAHNTLELPTVSMRKLGYNIQPMKVASALVKGSSEMNAADGIRSTLRLGDSALIVGEVRSAEAKALYEAMRVGAAANVVAGTIHGDSPYGIFDRVVNDIGVPKTSFKATDICIIANPVKSADGLHKFRRVTQITEVRKTWEEDPLIENGFVDLMKYDAKIDKLVPSDEMLNGDSEILKLIASNIKEFAGNWNAVWENIQLRTQIKETQVNLAKQLNDPDMLEAPFTIKCNDSYHNIIATVKDEIGSMDPKRVFFEWNNWMKREVKKRGTSEKM